MLHPRQFTFGAARIRPAKIISNNEAEHGVTKELERLVVQFARFELVARCDPFVGPGPMCDRAFEQGSIFEAVIQNRFEEVEVRDRFGVFQSVADYTKRRKLVLIDELPALRRKEKPIVTGAASSEQQGWLLPVYCSPKQAWRLGSRLA